MLLILEVPVFTGDAKWRKKLISGDVSTLTRETKEFGEIILHVPWDL